MTVETDTESGLAGMLQPGNYVDVIVTIRPDDANIEAKWVTETILQGIRVLAVGSSLTLAREEEDSSRSGRGSRSRSSATLELTLTEAEKLALASSKGDVHLVLRNDIDITQLTTAAPLSTAALIGYDDPDTPPRRASSRPAAPAEPATQTVEIIGDNNAEAVQYDENGNRLSGGQ